MSRPLRIAMCAGEASGDQLGALLIEDLKALYPEVECVGITGSKMRAAGCVSLGDYEPLAVNGLFEILRHLPRLLRFRKHLVQAIIEAKPDIFIGFDAPDFNLGVAKRLRARGIKTLHYVSPSVWAWRPGRVKSIAESVDGVLCLLPFEPECYRDTSLDAVFVGHPLADAVPLETDKTAAKVALGLSPTQRYLAVLPGSRGSELKQLANVFAETVARLHLIHQGAVHFLVPFTRAKHQAVFAAALQAQLTDLPVTFYADQGHEVLAAADVALVASGTASLESMLFRTPMVVAYKLSPISYWVVSTFKLMRIRRFSLPNIIADDLVVPEFIQGNAKADYLTDALNALLRSDGEKAKERFLSLHKKLKAPEPMAAAKAVLRQVGVL